MIRLLKRIIYKIKETNWKYKLQGSDVRIQGEIITPNNHITIKKSTIYVDYNSTIILHEGVRLEGIGLWVTNGGRVEIGAHSFLERSSNATKPEYIVNSGVLRVADHTKLACQRLWIRFGGSIEVGQYHQREPWQ